MIKLEWQKIHEAMLQDIANCEAATKDPKALIECCFSVAQDYWSRMQNLVESYKYETQAEEIYFYKTIKPLFRSHIEYYNLVYHAELFKPITNPVEMKEFWIKEQQRLDKFIQDNKMFYEYHKSGSDQHDEEFFLLPASMDESGKALYHDDLIAMLIALEKYSQYIQHELDRI